MNPIDIGTADRLIRYHNRMREGRGLVLEKNPDGRTLKVDVFGKGVTDCATDRGVWGAVRVGDRVKVDTRTVPTVTGTYERFGPANSMQRVGEDFSTGETASVSTYETLLDVSGLVIPPDASFEMFWTAQAIAVGDPGSANKELRIVLNDEPGIDLSFTSGSVVTVGDRVFVSPLATGFQTPLRYVGGQVGSWTYASLEGEINRVRLQGRTNDSEQGNDLLRGQNMAVFA